MYYATFSDIFVVFQYVIFQENEDRNEVPTTSKDSENPYEMNLNNSLDNKNCSEQNGGGDHSLLSVFFSHN